MARRSWRLVGAMLAVAASGAFVELIVAQQTSWVRTGVTGRLIYVPDAEGDRIPDFSMVGYGAGSAKYPATFRS